MKKIRKKTILKLAAAAASSFLCPASASIRFLSVLRS